MVLGLVVGASGVVFFVRAAGGGLIESFTTPVRVTPVDVTLDLDDGTYVIYEATARSSGAGSISTTVGRGVTITPEDVSVVSSSGDQLQMETTRFDITIDRGNLTYTGAVQFDVDRSGSYRVQIDGSGQQVIIAPSLIGSIGSAVAWLSLIGIGGLLVVIGLVLLIVGLVRGRRQPTVAAGTPPPAVEQPAVPVPATPPAPTTPAGWYPDPYAVARLRWWDGQQWTEHVS
jgi:hypothetical protein